MEEILHQRQSLTPSKGIICFCLEPLRKHRGGSIPRSLPSRLTAIYLSDYTLPDKPKRAIWRSSPSMRTRLILLLCLPLDDSKLDRSQNFSTTLKKTQNWKQNCNDEHAATNKLQNLHGLCQLSLSYTYVDRHRLSNGLTLLWTDMLTAALNRASEGLRGQGIRR